VQSSRKSRLGFTLIELLVVIAIIGVLIGILLPVLSRANAAAKRVACGSNLRSMHTAMVLYMDNGDGLVPFAEFPAAFSRGFTAPYGEIAEHMDVELPRHVDGTFERTQPWACPSDSEKYKKAGTSYLYNIFPLFIMIPPGGNPRATVTRHYFEDSSGVFTSSGGALLFQDSESFHGEGQPGKNAVRTDGSVMRLPPRGF